MPAYIILDTQEPERLTHFWCELQGVEVLLAYDEGRYTALGPNREGLMLVLQKVPEPKSGKNRAHFDVVVDDLERATAEVERGRPLARTRSDARARGFCGAQADPEGNEFCLYLCCRHEQRRAASSLTAVAIRGRTVSNNRY